MLLRNRNNQTNPGKKASVFNPQNPLTQEKTSKSKNIVNSQTSSSDLILVVDDNPSNLDSLFLSLEKAGFEIVVAEDGEIAIEIAESTQPDLILLSILMAG